jgi:hypothetical protein
MNPGIFLGGPDYRHRPSPGQQVSVQVKVTVRVRTGSKAWQQSRKSAPLQGSPQPFQG